MSNTIFQCLYLYRRKTTSLRAGTPSDRRMVWWSTMEDPRADEDNANVRILSWNLDSFQVMPYPNRFLDVFGVGYQTRFDLIATMETSVDNHHHLGSQLDAFDSWHASKQHPNHHRQGQALYWRRSVFGSMSRQTVALAATGVAVVVRLLHKTTNRPVVVVVVHLKSWPTKGDNCQTIRETQARTIEAFLTTYLTPDDALVVMGDWNEPAAVGNVHRFEQQFGLSDVYGSLCGSHQDESTMIDQEWLVDHALVSSGLDVVKVYPTGKLQYAFGLGVTDHFPLRFDVRITSMK